MERQLQVPAEPRQVMEWLTDHQRRAQDWWQRVEASPGVQDAAVAHLPDGGLRFDATVPMGNGWLSRSRFEDKAFWSLGVKRVAHAVLIRGKRRVAYTLQERVTLSLLPDGTAVAVSVRGRLAGMSLFWHLMDRSSPGAIRFLESHIARQADFRISQLTAAFLAAQASNDPA